MALLLYLLLKKIKEATQQQNYVQQETTGVYYEKTKRITLADIDKFTQDLGKHSKAADYKTTLSLVEKLLPILLKDIKKGNFNNSIKSMAMFGTALIPYGGAFLSQIIGILWPDSADNTNENAMQKNEGRTCFHDGREN
ncbi:hypothetical protein COE56_28940 [Bacillus anthracis]|nr:hypothetical protein COE56_28940 [Bacillus anthracis]